MNSMEPFFLKISTTHPRLVGQDHNREPGAINFFNRLNHTREQCELLHIPEVADIAVHGSVPIQEDRWDACRISGPAHRPSLPMYLQ